MEEWRGVQCAYSNRWPSTGGVARGEALREGMERSGIGLGTRFVAVELATKELALSLEK